MPNFKKSPICRANWHQHCYHADRKYTDRNNIGVFSITGSFEREARDELEKDILAQIGEAGKGTYHFKSEGNGNTAVKFKIKEKLKDRNGKEIIQQPTVFYKGEKFESDFEHAQIRILYNATLFKQYMKTSLLLKGIEIINLADDDYQSDDEKDMAILKKMDATNVKA